MMLKDFKCKFCKTVLAKTNGNFVRVDLQGLIAEVKISKFEFLCPKCFRVRVWHALEKEIIDSEGKKEQT